MATKKKSKKQQETDAKPVESPEQEASQSDDAVPPKKQQETDAKPAESPEQEASQDAQSDDAVPPSEGDGASATDRVSDEPAVESSADPKAAEMVDVANENITARDVTRMKTESNLDAVHGRTRMTQALQQVVYAKDGLRLREVDVRAMKEARDHPLGIEASAIGIKIGAGTSDIHGILTELNARGLVRRVVTPKRIVFHSTPKGTKILGELHM